MKFQFGTEHEVAIADAVTELKSSFSQLIEVAQEFGFHPIATSFNPHQTAFIPEPPLNAYELNRMQQLAFLQDPNVLIESDPSLTKLTSKPAEWGRIEFKALSPSEMH